MQLQCYENAIVWTIFLKETLRKQTLFFLFVQPQEMTNVLEILNYIFTGIFALEMLLKLLALGVYGYIRDAFNLFDGAIVIVR